MYRVVVMAVEFMRVVIGDVEGLRDMFTPGE